MIFGQGDLYGTRCHFRPKSFKTLKYACLVFANIFFFAILSDEKFFPGHAGRILGPVGNTKLFLSISRYYYTEESTRHLANLLLKSDDDRFIQHEVPYLKVLEDKVNWTETAWKVLMKWSETNKPHSITLLCAMEKSNENAAGVFRGFLTNREFLNVLSSFFAHYIAPSTSLSLSLSLSPSISLTTKTFLSWSFFNWQPNPFPNPLPFYFSYYDVSVPCSLAL